MDEEGEAEDEFRDRGYGIEGIMRESSFDKVGCNTGMEGKLEEVVAERTEFSSFSSDVSNIA